MPAFEVTSWISCQHELESWGYPYHKRYEVNTLDLAAENAQDDLRILLDKAARAGDHMVDGQIISIIRVRL